MEEELKTIDTEIVEDMPDFEEETTETACESAESVDNQSADSENEIVSEEKSEETAEKTEDKQKEDKAEDKSFYQWNPLQMAIKPFYEKAIAEDELFAKEVKEKESREKNPKSLAECAEYILGEAYHYASSHRSGNFGMAGMPDEDMVGLIKHYYDEDDIVIRKMTGAKAKVVATKDNKEKDKGKGKDKKKGAEKPKPKPNVVDITKAIVTATKPKEDGKKGKREKKKDNLLAGFVPMERPDLETYEKDAKKGSREQAKSVEQMDLFADFFAE